MSGDIIIIILLTLEPAQTLRHKHKNMLGCCFLLHIISIWWSNSLLKTLALNLCSWLIFCLSAGMVLTSYLKSPSTQPLLFPSVGWLSFTVTFVLTFILLNKILYNQVIINYHTANLEQGARYLRPGVLVVSESKKLNHVLSSVSTVLMCTLRWYTLCTEGRSAGVQHLGFIVVVFYCWLQKID